jgi:hypothetical protein
LRLIDRAGARLRHETNVRHVEVQKSGALSSLGVGDQQGATIIHVEPLAP